jgi:hypothetical protein
VECIACSLLGGIPIASSDRPRPSLFLAFLPAPPSARARKAVARVCRIGRPSRVLRAVSEVTTCRSTPRRRSVQVPLLQVPERDQDEHTYARKSLSTQIGTP